jgi:hypothetical protein
MGDKKQKKNKKQRRNARSKAVDETSKRGKLPSSVQALLGYLGGGGPTPMYQQPVNLQKERAGVDSMETLSQIIRQQNMMNMSYMQNMEKLAFKNEMQEQLKKQGQQNQEEIKQQSQVQKQEQEKVNQALKETTERTIQQQRVSLMRKLSYESKHKNRPDIILSLQEQLEILNGGLRDAQVSDLRSSLHQKSGAFASRMPTGGYSAPIATQTPMNLDQDVAEAMDMSGFMARQVVSHPSPLFNSPSVFVDPALTTRIVDRLPALDPNVALPKQLLDFEKHIAKQVTRQTGPGNSSQEIGAGLDSFAFNDAYSSSGTLSQGAGASAVGKIASSYKVTRTPPVGNRSKVGVDKN